MVTTSIVVACRGKREETERQGKWRVKYFGVWVFRGLDFDHSVGISNDWEYASSIYNGNPITSETKPFFCYFTKPGPERERERERHF